MEALLRIGMCPCQAISMFNFVKRLLGSLEKFNVMRCPWDCNENANEAIKWVASVMKNGNGFLSNVPPNIEACILHDSFVALIK